VKPRRQGTFDSWCGRLAPGRQFQRDGSRGALAKPAQGLADPQERECIRRQVMNPLLARATL
jgi:hypothetical protein